jgi:hypothetical protein
MTTVEFPEELEKHIHALVLELGKLLPLVPIQTPDVTGTPESLKALSPDDMIELTSHLTLDASRKTLLAACGAYEAATAVHRMLTPGRRPHA